MANGTHPPPLLRPLFVRERLGGGGCLQGADASLPPFIHKGIRESRGPDLRAREQHPARQTSGPNQI